MHDLSTLLSDLVLGESARWHGGRLWLCDWGAGEVLSIDPTGHREVVASVAGLPFSVDWTPCGRLLLLSGSTVARLDQHGRPCPWADLGHLAGTPWNEMVLDRKGNAYVNNLGFDLMGGAQPAGGFVALVTPDGRARAVADDLHFPNGMAVTADGSTLLVAESYARRVTAFDIEPDGTLSGRRAWAQVQGPPDGICLDAEGALWYADVPNCRCVRIREGGDVLEQVTVDRGCFSCVLGGPEGRTLHIAAAAWAGAGLATTGLRTGMVLTVDVRVPAAGLPA